uniref:E4 protein n=1 Tax=Human papillomavirus TaxID=10566 RepID=A0A385PKD1_9PAPI|nr:MAG: E4 protein [Human papillomavirus]
MQSLLLLLLVLVGVPVPGTPRLPRAPTPWSDRHKKKEEPISTPVPRDELDRARARARGTRVRRNLESDFDGEEDEEKENKAPDETLEEPQDPITSLLQKWGEDIDWLKRKVSTDLDNFKKRLGIRP